MISAKSAINKIRDSLSSFHVEDFALVGANIMKEYGVKVSKEVLEAVIKQHYSTYSIPLHGMTLERLGELTTKYPGAKILMDGQPRLEIQNYFPGEGDREDLVQFITRHYETLRGNLPKKDKR